VDEAVHQGHEQAASAPELQNYFTKDPGERLRK
jgi:hypothetical protein